MKEICNFCGEDEAVKQRRNPNGEWDTSGDIWNVCWECDQYIDWSMQHMCATILNMPIKPFDEWLFEKHQVYPKHESLACILKKKPLFVNGVKK